MVYQWKTPGLYKISPDVAAAELEECRNPDGVITPSDVVERAKSHDSPLHEIFEWNNTKAANKWRESQARTMIANIMTVMEINEGEEKRTVTVRAYPHINGDGEEGRGYKPLKVVLENSQDKEYLLQRAKAELASFQMKYRNLSELTSVLEAISKLLEG
jgi:hypothetical protein